MKKKPSKHGKKKRSERKITKEKLLKLWSRVAFHLNPHKPFCEVCKKRKATQTHHFYGKKSHPSVMFDPKNAVNSCYYCHIYQVHQQGDSEHMRLALIERIGMMEFILLTERAHQKEKLHLLDYDRIQVELSSLLE